MEGKKQRVQPNKVNPDPSANASVVNPRSFSIPACLIRPLLQSRSLPLVIDRSLTVQRDFLGSNLLARPLLAFRVKLDSLLHQRHQALGIGTHSGGRNQHAKVLICSEKATSIFSAAGSESLLGTLDLERWQLAWKTVKENVIN